AALARASLWALLLPVAAAGLVALLRWGRPAHIVLTVGGASAALLLVFFQLVAPRLSEVHSDAQLAEVLHAAPGHAGAPVVASRFRSPSMSFSSQRPLLLYDRPRQLRALIAEHGLVFVVTSPQHVAELRASGPFVPWRVGPRRVLYATRPPPEPVDGAT